MKKTVTDKSHKLTNIKALWAYLLVGSTIGLLASFIQTIERINYAKNPKVPLVCDLNPVFSCGNVFDAWQSAVFGFSNSLMCIVFFAVTMGIALTGITSSQINRKLRYVFHFFSLFFLGFGAWYLWQSTYRIGYICIFCVFCYLAVILMNWAWLRINGDDIFKNSKYSAAWVKAKKSGADTFLWLTWAIVVGASIALHFW